jgi:hypothetical protein
MEQPINNRTLDPKEWALTIFISRLPLIGLIMILVWAFSEGNTHRKNWAQGTLILWVIALAIALAFLFLFGGLAMINSWVN